jgi:hypothetical protein
MVEVSKEKTMDLKTLPAKTLYTMAHYRWSYSRSRGELDNYINNAWFLSPVFKELTGKTPRWGWQNNVSAEDKPFADQSAEIMRKFCEMTDAEVEGLLVSRSTLDAAHYSIRYKRSRLDPAVEREFMEKCKGKKSRMNALVTYCGKWEIMPENMTEITMIAGFEGGRRGRIGSDFIKKLAENKRKCRDLLTQIMKLEGIDENEPITKILERL